MRKHRAARAGHPAAEPQRSKPIEGLRDAWTKPLRNALQVVSTETERVRREAWKYSSVAVPFECWVRENRMGG